jgi:hypothetical protein
MNCMLIIFFYIKYIFLKIYLDDIHLKDSLWLGVTIRSYDLMRIDIYWNKIRNNHLCFNTIFLDPCEVDSLSIYDGIYMWVTVGRTLLVRRTFLTKLTISNLTKDNEVSLTIFVGIIWISRLLMFEGLCKESWN